MNTSLVVLAAGMGSRYGGLKQIDPVGPAGEVILDYSIHDALKAGVSNVVFVIRRDIEPAFREAVGRRYEDRVPVAYAFQELDALPDGLSPPPDRAKPWGTAHAILTANSAVDSPFIAINADDFYGARSFGVLARHLLDTPTIDAAEYAMVGFVLRNTLSDAGSVSRGVCRSDGDGYLVQISEYTDVERDGSGARHTAGDGTVRALTGEELVSMNMWGFLPSLFDQLRKGFRRFVVENGTDPKAEFSIPTAVNDLIVSGAARVRVLSTPDAWCGVTYPQDRPQVTAHIRQLVDRGVYPSPLWT
jgi:hypothetical protein